MRALDGHPGLSMLPVNSRQHPLAVRASLDALVSPRQPASPIDEHAPFGAGNAAPRVVSVLDTTLLSQAYA